MNREDEGARVAAAREAVAKNPFWYHTIELAPGVVTPGFVDLRKSAPRLLPRDLTGKRALDVGTFDGFWCFEMERRGAEVVAMDVDDVGSGDLPPASNLAIPDSMKLGEGFRLAADCLGSAASRVACNVYDLSPEALGGPVDFAFSGALLIHLRDPVLALERIRGALVPGGTVLAREPISLRLTLLSPRSPAAQFEAATSDVNWWMPNAATIVSWLRTAGFDQVRRVALSRPPTRRQGRPICMGVSGRRPPEP